MRGKCYCDQCHKYYEVKCPKGHDLPIICVTIDLIVEEDGKLWLVKREDGSWALPGGFVDYDETIEEAAEREGREELGAKKVTLLSQFHTYGDPARDVRRTVAVVFLARVDRVAPSKEELDKDGLQEVRAFPLDQIPEKLAFDHSEIVADYLAFRRRLLPLRVRRAGK